MRPHVQDGVAVAGAQQGWTRSTASSDAADEQGHVARGDVVRAAADRRVDDVDAAGVGRRSLSAVRGLPVVWMTSTAPGASRQRDRSQADLLHLLVGEHADDDRVSALGDARPDRSPAARPSSLTARALLDGSTERARRRGLASTSRRTIGLPMRPAPTKPTSRHRGKSIDCKCGVGGVEHHAALGSRCACRAMLAACRTSFCSNAPAMGASWSRVPPKTGNAAERLAGRRSRR